MWDCFEEDIKYLGIIITDQIGSDPLDLLIYRNYTQTGLLVSIIALA